MVLGGGGDVGGRCSIFSTSRGSRVSIILDGIWQGEVDGGGGQENTVLKGASKRYRPLNFFFLGLWGIANWREKIIELNKNIGTADWLSGFGYAAAINSNPLFTNAPPAGIYFFIGNRNNRAMCEICSKLTMKCRHWRGLSLLLNLNIFHILFWCCNCWLWKVNAGRVDYACLE